MSYRQRLVQQNAWNAQRKAILAGLNTLNSQNFPLTGGRAITFMPHDEYAAGVFKAITHNELTGATEVVRGAPTDLGLNQADTIVGDVDERWMGVTNGSWSELSGGGGVSSAGALVAPCCKRVTSA